MDEMIPPSLRHRYRPQGLLGSGGMGRVVSAWDVLRGHEVALKLVHRQDLQEGGRIREEFTLLQRLRHPGIVRVHDLGIAEGILHLSTDLVTGVTLDQWLMDLPTDAQVTRLLSRLLQTLAWLHGQGVLHGDLKPANVLVRHVGAHWEPVLIDFGLARNTSDPLLGGTPSFMAPALLRGESGGVHGDLYALHKSLDSWQTTSPILQRWRLKLGAPQPENGYPGAQAALEALPGAATMHDQLGGRSLAAWWLPHRDDLVTRILHAEGPLHLVTHSAAGATDLASMMTASLNLSGEPALPYEPRGHTTPALPWLRWVEALGGTLSGASERTSGDPVPLAEDRDLEFDLIVNQLQSALADVPLRATRTLLVNPQQWPEAHQEIFQRLLHCGIDLPLIIVAPAPVDGSLKAALDPMDRVEPISGGTKELQALLRTHGAPEPSDPTLRKLLEARLPAGPAAVRAQLDAWTHAGLLHCGQEGWEWSQDKAPSLSEIPAPDHLWPALWASLSAEAKAALVELHLLGGLLDLDSFLLHVESDASLLTRLVDEGWTSLEFGNGLLMHPGAMRWIGSEVDPTGTGDDGRRLPVLEALGDARVVSQNEALARLFLRSGSVDRAAELLADVAAHHEAALTPGPAGHAWIEAATHTSNARDRTDRMERGIRLLLMAGERAAAQAHAETLLEWDSEASVSLLLAHVAIHSGKPGDALTALERESAEWTPSQRMHRALSRGTALSLQGDRASATDSLLEAETMARDLAAGHALGRITNNLGNLAFQARDWDGAVDAYQRSLDAKDRIGDLRGVRIARANRALALRQRGDHGEGLSDLDEALRVARQIGDAPGYQYVALVRGHMLLDCALISAAEDALAQFLAIPAGSLAMELEGQMLLARLRRARGEHEDALDLLHKTSDSASAGGFGLLQGEAMVALRHVTVLREHHTGILNNDPHDALQDVESALRITRQSGDDSGSLSLRAAHCHALARTGDWHRSRALLANILPEIQNGLAPGEESTLAFTLWAAEHLGDGEAQEMLESAREDLVAQRMDAARDRADTLSIHRGDLLKALGLPEMGGPRIPTRVDPSALTEVHMPSTSPLSPLSIREPDSPVAWAEALGTRFQARNCIFLSLASEGDPVLGQFGVEALPSARWRETRAAMRRGFPFFAPSTGPVELAAWPLANHEEGPQAALILTWAPGEGFESTHIDGLVQPLLNWAGLMARTMILSDTLAATREASHKRAEGVERSEQFRAEEVSQLREALHQSQAFSQLRHHYGNIVHDSSGMRRVLRMLDKVMQVDLPVMLRGESGVGKEVVARALHHNGPRAHGPFVGENCAAIPPDLFESVFFGHVRGAFTGATNNQSGLLEAADGGTLFLDEFGELRADHQVKLLRVLQEKTFRPVGSQQEISVDFRLITATNQNLEALVEAGTFREDLYWRAAVVAIDIPPLRQRRDDILPLVNHFLESITDPGAAPMALQAAAAEALVRHDWPGNVRELQNAILRASALTSSDEIRVEHLSPRVLGKGPRSGKDAEWDGVSTLADLVDTLERKTILSALDRSHGQKAGAARMLGISRPGLDAKMTRLEIPYNRRKQLAGVPHPRSH